MMILNSKTKFAILFTALFSLSLPVIADNDKHDEHDKEQEYKKHEKGNKTLTEAQKQAYIQKAMTENKVLPKLTHSNWVAECSSCHSLYHPNLLPARSWSKMMSSLDKHFGDVATVTPAVNKDILNFLLANSAEKATNARSQKILASIPANVTPLRISETPYIEKKHKEIKSDVFKRSKIGSKGNCFACHTTAEQGYFSEKTVIIPK